MVNYSSKRMDWSICYQLLTDQRKRWCRIATLGLNTYSDYDSDKRYPFQIWLKFCIISIATYRRKIVEKPTIPAVFGGKMEPLQLRFLGDVRIEQGNNTYVDQLPGKAIALICYLAVTNEVQTRNTLASLLWSDFPEHRARGNLRDTLTSLRRTPLAPYVSIGRRIVNINEVFGYYLDTAEFLRKIRIK